MTDTIVRAMSASGGIRVLTCSVSGLAREICSLQQASATVSVALGRGLAGGALLGAQLKPGQRVALKFEGNGPMRKMIIEAESDGAVRGCVGDPGAEAEPQNGKWNVPDVLGHAGFLTVSKDLGMGGEPYHGMVQLRSSEIGDDLAYYLTDSEQVPSAVGLSASLNEEGGVALCGGFLVQALPKADSAEIDEMMQRIAGLPPLCALLQEGGPEAIMSGLFGGMAYNLLETREVFFRCGCSKAKVERALLTLGPDELREMGEKEQGADITCEFCRQRYRFDEAELAALAVRSPASAGV
ncbi:Hsp33 family molecular chaperone HslO [Oryzomonas japonica]|uniref:33 kDa chaperonin n=1 Tax=Oryzomonas japonica TaxID=2603858 RepID=A0A7J4ZUD7_9BACT|nr:Hsp33 family molecular chaperone HslO [Oryzomonas japonica]KAB0667142.1 Hsp33 family molecular chaperone HslO [Oryzomonas japonica]